MAEIIDILTPKQTQCPAFTVVAPATAGNIAVSMNSPYPVTPDKKLYVDGAAFGAVYGRFQSRDNIRLLTAGFYIPESFVLASTWGLNPDKPNVKIAANELQISVLRSNLSTAGFLPGLGARGTVGLPFANYEIALDLFCDMSNPPPTVYTSFDPTSALPSNPSVGNTYLATATANGWVSGNYYEWSGAAWTDVSGISLLADNEFYLEATLFMADISMIGVPSLLNGSVIRVIPFIKILHSLPLIA